MVITAFITWLADVVSWFAGLVPDVPDDVVALVQEATTALDGFVAQMAVLGPVVPFDIVNVCWGAILATFGLGIAIELVRMLLSYLTLGGGAI